MVRFINGPYNDRLGIIGGCSAAIAGGLLALGAHASFDSAEKAPTAAIEAQHTNIGVIHAIGSGILELTAGASATAIIINRRRINS